MDRDMPQEFIQRAKFELEYTQNDPLGMEGRFAMLRSSQLNFEQNRGLSPATSSSSASSSWRSF